MDLVSIAIFAGATVSLLYKGFRLIPKNNGAKRAARAVPKSKLVDVQGNQVVRVVGQIAPLEETLIAPLTGRPCVCYELEIEEAITEERETRWVMLAQDTHRKNFLLQQGDEVALVKVRYASIHFVDSLRASSSMKKAPLRVQEFLEKRGELTTGSHRSIRYREGLLEPGQIASACGYATREIDLHAESAGYRDAGTRLLFEHQEEHSLYLSNDPKTLL